MHVERTFSVAQPVEIVFDYLADFTHTNDWDPGTVETRRTSGDGGVGTTYANTSEFMGRKTELTYETITFERPRRLQFRGTNESATATDTMTFAPSACMRSIVPACSPYPSFRRSGTKCVTDAPISSSARRRMTVALMPSTS